jgi:HAD superfamily hydrolase (TIGR01484 family)
MESPDMTPARAADRQILATDLDGTLIPLDDDPQNRADLRTLAEQLDRQGVQLIFVTGRHFASAAQAMENYRLPAPAWLICDVGTSIFQRQASGRFEAVADYQQHQARIIAELPMEALRRRLEAMDALRLQEPDKQGKFKLSFYTDAARLEDVVARLRQVLKRTAAPYSVIASVDPFTGDGLIDVLPATVSKAHALSWLVRRFRIRPEAIVFAGDSGNDLAALTAGYRAILVGNAQRAVAEQARRVHRESGWEDRLYLARGKATSGVLEGCRWFGLLEQD